MRINNIKLCEVVSVDDEYDGDRIKVRVYPDDNNKTIDELPWAFPFLPKHLHIKPKVGEMVEIIFNNANDAESIRRYVGPVVSQPQDFNFSEFGTTSTSLMNFSNSRPKKAVSSNPDTRYLMGRNEDVAIFGRKHGDIIITENDVNIRCGVRKEGTNNEELSFNKLDPAYIKLKYNPFSVGKGDNKFNSSATVVADKITLVSNNSSTGDANIYNTDNLISNEDMEKLIESAQRLPYGDKLLDFIKVFLNAFKTHTHRFVGAGSYPVESDSMKALNNYNDEKLDGLLSKDIKII